MGGWGGEIRSLKMHVLPNQACSPGCPGFLDHSAYCGKGQGHKVSNTPLDAECLPQSLSDCGPSARCSGPADRLQGKVSTSKQQRYETLLEPPPGESGRQNGIKTPSRDGLQRFSMVLM